MPRIERKWSLAAAIVAAGMVLAGCQEKPTQDIQGAINETLRQTGAQAESSGNWAEAVINYRGLFQRNPTDPATALGLIRALRNAGQPEEAVRIGGAVIAQHPQDANLLSEYAKARVATRDVRGAITTLQAAIDAAPGDWTLQSALGIAYDLADDHERAQEAYLKALEIAPGNATVTNNLALSLALAGNIEAGIAKLETVRPTVRGATQARQSLALLYAVRGDLRRTESIMRSDLPDKLASENLAYYRALNGVDP